MAMLQPEDVFDPEDIPRPVFAIGMGVNKMAFDFNPLDGAVCRACAHVSPFFAGFCSSAPEFAIAGEGDGPRLSRLGLHGVAVAIEDDRAAPARSSETAGSSAPPLEPAPWRQGVVLLRRRDGLRRAQRLAGI